MTRSIPMPTDPDPVPTHLVSRAARRRHRAQVRRRRTLAVALAVLVAGGTTGLVLAGQRTDVTITDDGASTVVSARKGRTVAEELAARHISVTAADKVTPAPSTQIKDTTRITIVRAKDVHVTVDGAARRGEVAATTVADVRAALGARPGAVVQVSRGQARTPLSANDKLPDGATITIRNPQRVTVTADGRTRTVSTTATTLEAAVKDAGVAFDADDQLRRTPDRATALPVTGDRVVVTRVATTHRTRTKTIPAPTRTVDDPKALLGTTKVRTPGKAGTVVTTERVTTHDGKVVEARVVRTVRTAPAAKVVARGTKKPTPKRTAARQPARGLTVAAAPAPASSSKASSPRASTKVPVTSKASGLNWAALAQCESSGNPAAVSPGGRYRGLYQFSMTTWRSVGGVGDPAAASVAEQTKRAQILYDRAGAGQWPVCGKLL